jgi:hypothetical protein
VCGGVIDPFLDAHSHEESAPPLESPPSETPSRIDSLPPDAGDDGASGKIVGGRYRLVREIGRGGFGVVYEAIDEVRHGRPVALKAMLPSRMADRSSRKRFEEETRVLASMHHPGIVRFLDAGVEGDAPFLVTALLKGTALRDWIVARRRLPAVNVLPEALPVFFQLLDALGFAHGFTAHLDLKPENIFLLEDGTLVLLDFGLARIADFRAQGRRLLGTAYYVAPEIVRGNDVVDYRADVYSAGVILYEMLRGELPIGVLAWPSRFLPGANARLDELLRRALQSDPVRRFRNLFDLRAALVSAFPGFRPPPEELALARRRLAGGDALAPLWLGALLEHHGAPREAQEAYKQAARRGRGTPVEEMARECLGYPRRKAVRFCILCGVDLPPGSRRASLCRDCRKGARKKRDEATAVPPRPEEALLRGPHGGAAFLRFAEKDHALLASGEFCEAVRIERSGEWRVAGTIEIPGGPCPAALSGGEDPALLLAGREAVLVGPAGNLRRFPPPENQNAEKEIAPVPTAACFASPQAAWVGDSTGEIREYPVGEDGDPSTWGRLEGAVIALRRLEGGAIIALSSQGQWGLWEAGPQSSPRVGRAPCPAVRLASVAFRAPLFALFAGGEILLSGPTGRKNPEWIRPPGRVHALGLHPEARWIAVGNERGDLDLLAPGGKVLRSFHLGRELVRSIEVSPDGEWIAASTLGGGIWIFRLEEETSKV